jgi:drug/metabolite transporter (DMT)-like permease
MNPVSGGHGPGERQAPNLTMTRRKPIVSLLTGRTDRCPRARGGVPDHATSASRATLVGLAAIVLWSGTVGLIRIVSQAFGAALGAALIYTLATGLLWATRRPPSLQSLPLRYVLVCGGLFVVSGVTIGLALGTAVDAHQAIEVGIVNYLWPTLTVLVSVVLPPWQRVRWTIVPGITLAVVGVVWVVGGDAHFDLARAAAHVSVGPLPYALALCGALAWALYSVLSPRLSGGHDGIVVFFAGTAVALWLVYLSSGMPATGRFDAAGVIALAVAALVLGTAYACWNVGILRGNLVVLASASYATPVLSSAVAALLLGAQLSATFWQGAVFVTLGSVLSWWATQDRSTA